MFRKLSRTWLWVLPVLACLSWFPAAAEAHPRFGYYGGYTYRPYTYYSPYRTYYAPYGTYYARPYSYGYSYYPYGTYYSPYYGTPYSSYYYSW